MESVTIKEVIQSNLYFNPFDFPEKTMEKFRLFLHNSLLNDIRECIDAMIGDSIDAGMMSPLISLLLKMIIERSKKQEIDVDIDSLIRFLLNSILESDLYSVRDRDVLDLAIESSFELIHFDKKEMYRKPIACSPSFFYRLFFFL